MFQFKQFSISDTRCGMKIGTDGVLLGAWADASRALTALDAGCGSGLIALMLAQRNPDLKIVAIDLLPNACADAAANVAASPWPDRVEVSEGDFNLFTLPSDTPRPLLIVSNPPFFTEALRSPELSREIARHGRGFNHLSLLESAARLLSTPDDRLCFIAPASADSEIEFAIELHRLCAVRICHVYTREGKPATRTMWEIALRTPSAPILRREKLAIRNCKNHYTSEYQRLTSEFYLDR